MSQDYPNSNPDAIQACIKRVNQIIAEHITREITSKLGYTFEAERVSRIATSGTALFSHNLLGQYFQQFPLAAFVSAFEVDLLLYGDPQAPVHEIKGIERVIKEIYGE